MLELLLLICGLVGLWAGSEVMIRGAISLADRYRVSDAMIGMMVLAIGTDLPEIFVAVDASIHSLAGKDYSGIVIGSAVGSCIGQFALVFGVAGFFGFSPRPRRLGLRNAAFLMGGLAALAVFSFNGIVSQLEGWLLIGFYIFYFMTLVLWPTGMDEAEEIVPDSPLAQDVAYLVGGLVFLWLAAEITVTHAAGFAEHIGMSNLTVSAVIIGMGSSLPELSVSLVALWKKRGGLSVGNLMGSNVLDTMLVPGIAAAMSPIVVPAAALAVDIPVQALVTVLVLGFLYMSPRGIKAPEAAVLLAIYITYATFRLAG